MIGFIVTFALFVVVPTWILLNAANNKNPTLETLALCSGGLTTVALVVMFIETTLSDYNEPGTLSILLFMLAFFVWFGLLIITALSTVEDTVESIKARFPRQDQPQPQVTSRQTPRQDPTPDPPYTREMRNEEIAHRYTTHHTDEPSAYYPSTTTTEEIQP